jgi:hypothetical protein
VRQFVRVLALAIFFGSVEAVGDLDVRGAGVGDDGAQFLLARFPGFARLRLARDKFPWRP